MTDYQAQRATAEAEEAERITQGLESGDLFPVSWSDLLTCVDGLRESIAQTNLTPDDEEDGTAMYMALLHTTSKADTLTRLLTALTNDASSHSRTKRREAYEKREEARKTTGAA